MLGPGEVLWEHQVTKNQSGGTWSNGRGGQPQDRQVIRVRFEGCLAVSDKVLNGADGLQSQGLCSEAGTAKLWDSGSQCMFSSGTQILQTLALLVI